MNFKKNIFPKQSTVLGAVMLEMSLVIIVLMMIIFSLFEVSMYYVKYSLLSYTTKLVVRRTIVDVGTARSVQELQMFAENRAYQILGGLLGHQPDNVFFIATVRRVEGGGHLLSLRGSWELDSVSQMLIPGNISVDSSELSTVADLCFRGDFV